MSSRTYTEWNASKWILNETLGQPTAREKALLDAWLQLRAANPAMTTMVVTDGLAVDGGDARSEAISVRISRVMEGKEK